MVTQTTRTKTPTYSFTNPYVQQSFDDEDDYSSPSFSSPSYTNSFSTTTTDTEPAFEIEKEYTGTAEPEKYEDQQEFTLVKQPMHTIARTAPAEGITQTKRALSPRLKIMLSVYSVVVALLIAFAIYNAVIISSGAALIASKQAEVASQTRVINSLKVEYNELGTDQYIRDSVGSDFVDSNSSNTFTIDMPEYTLPTDVEAPTNWFDKLCEFLSGLF